MKIIEIKKSFRNGIKIHHMFLPDDCFNEDLIAEWADSDPCGQNYGYRIDYEDVNDPAKMIELTAKHLEEIEVRFKRTVEEYESEISSTKKFLNTLTDKKDIL